MTRGRTANHLYLQLVGDGDPHSVIRPELIQPMTATDVLEQILANDQTAQSATTLQHQQHDPAVRLGDAAPRYVDALYVAAEDPAGPHIVEALEHSANQVVPGLTGEPAWPGALPSPRPVVAGANAALRPATNRRPQPRPRR